MLSQHIPRFQLLGETNLRPEFQHAILISVLRALAALQVVAAHLRAQLYPSLKSLPDPTVWYQALAFFTGFAHQAVVIFFLLSGWLVGGSLLNKLQQPNIMLSYAIDRVTRLWIVLIPAFVLTLLLAIASTEVRPGTLDWSPDNPYSLGAFLGNLFGLQDMVVPRFGGNFALWSLANEIWYYALFPLLVLPLTSSTRTQRWIAATALVLILSQLTTDIVLYFAIWLMGAACSRLRIDAARATRWLFIALLVGVSVYCRLTGSNDKLEADSFAQDLLFSLVFMLVLCSRQIPANLASRTVAMVRRWGERMAAFSFTLYVIHVPLLLSLRDWYGLSEAERMAPDNAGGFAVYLGMLGAIVVLAYLFHLPFEAQTNRVRGLIKQLVFGPRAQAAGLKHRVDVRG